MADKFINFPMRRILELSGMVINFTEISIVVLGEEVAINSSPIFQIETILSSFMPKKTSGYGAEPQDFRSIFLIWKMPISYQKNTGKNCY